MNFTARLERGSPIWRDWRERRRVGGVLAGVMFSWVPGDDYVAPGGLSAAEVGMLRKVVGVRLEMVDAAAPTPLPFPMGASSAVPSVADVPVVASMAVPEGTIELRTESQSVRAVGVGTAARPKAKGRR